MPFELELKDPERKITLETDVAILVGTPRVAAFASAISALHSAVPLLSFVGQRTANPLVYSYTFTTADARAWAQTISFEDGVRMTFNVPGYWRLDEFVPHRAVRDEFVLLVRDYGVVRAEVLYGV